MSEQLKKSWNYYWNDITEIINSNPTISNTDIAKLIDKKYKLNLNYNGIESFRKHIGRNRQNLSVKPVIIEDTKIHLILGCVHIPFHNRVVLNKILQLINNNKNNIGSINLIGDFADINSCSKYDKGKLPIVQGLTIQKEYEEIKDILYTLCNIVNTKQVDINYLYGNHEGRIFNYNSDIQNSKTPILTPKEKFKNLDINLS
jgi:hypothetical protein